MNEQMDKEWKWKWNGMEWNGMEMEGETSAETTSCKPNVARAAGRAWRTILTRTIKESHISQFGELDKRVSTENKEFYGLFSL